MTDSKADEILTSVLKELKIINSTPKEKFRNIYKILPKLEERNKSKTLEVSTTGTISERICEWALQSSIPEGYFRLTSNDDKWLGDYCLLGVPFNVVISVKSYKVKERLLVSGSGSLLVPTIGWGLMNDPDEFKFKRLKNYLYRGFIAIYMPKYTLDQIEEESKTLENTHKQKLIRPIENLISDISNSLQSKKFGKRKVNLVNPKIF